jgi:nitrite reductase/ring-hydroxylating ferredoxin subunit
MTFTEAPAQGGVRLCRLDDIPDGGSNGFVVERDGVRRGYLAVRRGGRVHVYVNVCPHIGSPLDFQPGQFLNRERTLIQCSTHGALFRIEDGYCLAGPCAGKSLEAAPTEVAGGAVYLVR